MLALPSLPPPILNEDRLDYDLDLCFEYLDLLASRAKKSRNKSKILVKWRNCYQMMSVCTMVFFNRKQERMPILIERARRRAVNTARYNKLHPIEVRLKAAILQSSKINEDQIAFREAIKKAHSEAMGPDGKLKEELKDKWKPEQRARIEPETETPSGDGKDNDKHADVFVELGFFLNHLALQLYPPPRYHEAVQDKTVGLTELILSSGWRDLRDAMKRSWNPSVPLRPVIVQALDYYTQDGSISRNQSKAVLGVFDVLPLYQKQTQPPFWGNLDLSNELEQWRQSII